MTFECTSGDWARKWDAGTSTFYYVNVISHISSWAVPPGWVEPAAGPAEAINSSEGMPNGSHDEEKEKYGARESLQTTYYGGFDPLNTLDFFAAAKLVFKASELQSTPRLEQAALLMAKATGPAAAEDAAATVRAIRALLSDERAYFQDLQVIAMEFEVTLYQMKGQGAGKEELLSPAEMNMILKNIPDLFALHLQFTQDVSEYRSDSQLLSPELVDLLTNLVMSLEPYTFYVSECKRDIRSSEELSVLQLLERWEMDRPAVKATLDHIRSANCLTGTAKPIAHYLEAPLTRPATYGGLVLNVLRTVDPSTEAFKLWHDLLQKCEFTSQKIEQNAH